MARKVMRVIDRHIGLMECRACGARHQPLQPAGGKRLPRGAWQCLNGCTWDDVVRAEQKRGLRDENGVWLFPGIGED